MAGIFKTAFENIGNALSDFSSLEVTTYKGKVNISATDAIPNGFDSILENAKAEANFRLLASTKAHIDKDTVVFHDEDITPEEEASHNELFEIATENRLAIVQMFASAIDRDISS